MRAAVFILALSLLGQSPESLIQGGHFKRARAACLLAKVKRNFNDLDAALKLAEKGVALDPKSAACHFILAETVGTIAERANVLRQMGLAKRFKREIDATLALDPKRLDAARGYLAEAWLARREKQTDRLELMPDLDPANPAKKDLKRLKS